MSAVIREELTTYQDASGHVGLRLLWALYVEGHLTSHGRSESEARQIAADMDLDRVTVEASPVVLRALAIEAARPTVRALRAVGEVAAERALVDALLWGDETAVESAMRSACELLESLDGDERQAVLAAMAARGVL